MTYRAALAAALLLALPPAFAGDLDPDTALITEGTLSVTVADFEAAVSAMPKRQRAAVSKNPANVQNVIDALFLHRLLAREAREAGLDTATHAPLVIEQALERTLAQMRLHQIEEEIRPETVGRVARERYQANRARYRQPEEANVAHLLIRVNDETPDAEAKAQIEALQVRLSEGADFSELAREFSQDPGSAADGGALGTFGRGSMVEPFEEAAFATEPGQIAGPIRTEFGYHLIRVNERNEERLLSFDEVQDAIEAEVRAQLEAGERQAYLQELRQSGGGTVNWDAVNALIEQSR